MDAVNQAVSNADLLARIAELEGKLADKRAAGGSGLKVGEKGGVSFYGTGRFPVTSYPMGWVKIAQLVQSGDLRAFIAANFDKLSFKTPEQRVEVAAFFGIEL
jgi:hypothetical protein